ncbi:tyramine receptor 1-like [Acropora millepora]|uniref:tyramine receptor 1-like n=1 Tax=Acropora millepora TaxID=45264 RepID=UPI0010FCC222|nr:tyramine receptor 1-like [Acropora millepora]XP_029184411.1 tyramine receptor 1-like [Acropora millepora]XP_029184412.1 tyramine receptor 1-like [Acropora millepora]XP_029184414.1 tyramine receptor 1-like [Acropora millepora]XP_029184415.1 tyramine receptor 1-like [Acropora millepora]XP_029184416.1 tyramine receptor 1-like [Acropora millepora]XP_029184417.1 tyramine receptor 1-like [Acropora millepora]XP_029184418.1 tyramine receptor 1-like [Acropora millepora]XP_029184419.1 tyramine rec
MTSNSSVAQTSLTETQGTRFTLVDKCKQQVQGDFILQTAFLILIMIVTFLGNFMVCLTVYLHRRLRSVTNYFIVSLAVSDLLVSVLSLPFRIHQTLHNGIWCLGYHVCLTWIIVDIICSGASICNLAAISIDRYIAIVHPFRYHSVMTNTVAWVIIGAVWTYSATWAALSSFNWSNAEGVHFITTEVCQKRDRIFYTVVTVFAFYLPLAIVLVMYGFVFRVAMNQARAVANLQPVDMRDGPRTSRRFSINIVREVKAAKTLAIVIGAFTICWFPFFTFLLISLWNLKILRPPYLSEQALKGLRGTFLYVLPAINSTLNPIIYALFNREFRMAFFRLLQRTFRRQSLTRSHSSNNNEDSSQHTGNMNAANRNLRSPKPCKTNGHVRKITRIQEVYAEHSADGKIMDSKKV